MKKVIVTLLIILYLITLIKPPDKKISELKVGDYVSIKGNITQYYTPSRITIINLTDETGSIKTIFFQEVNTRKGKATIIGRVSEYQGELELIGVKIK